ncbi:tRNA 2-thiouridine(34) synthase MnmA [Coraliomargarita akajimensis]|uniref:tRNA-specific 2-thiouridylase MnmA n=1 Tax=Coraliomargarita akajimensis (strain DSM 45221 / IAM 15411 / JCM 23193 / KCTC 12865 / 04OKA010-24) TaxID=583355 RepID=D5EJP2_CORAD|nr:tRNA 2-thiouridine(34) synthase MnmA [Coraliomargarita akajimensis]ADE54641.1 tRNA(5-methylaminomethyl-2-thiouridylate)-methyl transferase [Coraliomargarita akajimensis DSM 45221]
MQKVLVALSGGVDSAVAALLLKEQGYAVSGAYIRTWMNEEAPLADCPAQQDIEDSRAVAQHLGIDYEIVNLVNEYSEHVVNYLVDGYKRGITPNPDMMCNREMKFGIFQNYALSQGFDAMATGHYVRKFKNEDGSFNLLEGIDKNKDQTYFLALLKQEQIAKALFPVGELQKPRVRELAIEHQLPNAAKKDSQGICFLGDMNINRFLEHYIEDRPGNIVNPEGKVLGQHRGLHRYTMGQRRGIGVPSNTDNEFYVVVGFNMEQNELIVAFDNPDSPGLFTQEVEVYGLSFVNKPVTEACRLLAKPRYRDSSQAITYTPTGPDSAKVVFDEPQRALASGQILALYEGETLLGGGFYR